MDRATTQLLDVSIPFNGQKLRTLEQHINNIYSSDPNLVLESNQVLTQLKQQDGLLLNIQQILEHASLDRTKFYVLVVFQQRLPSIWPVLTAEQRQSLRQYFVGLFMKFARAVLTADTRPISSTVTSVMVKLFLLGWQEWPTFLDDLVGQARTDQDLCDAVLSALDMFLDEMVEGTAPQDSSEARPAGGWSAETQAFVQSKLPSLGMLCFMIIEATTSNKLKQNLLKQALQILDKLVGLMRLSGGLPEQTMGTLLNLVRSNIHRQLVLKLLSTIAQFFYTPAFGRSMMEAVGSYLPNNVDLAVERNKLVELKNSKELQAFDVSMRNLACLLHRLIEGALTHPTEQEVVLQYYAYAVQLSILQEKETWASCMPCLLIYYRQNPVRQIPGAELMIESLVWRCVKPIELLERTADKQQAADYQFLVCALSTGYLAAFEKVIWNVIESHIYVKFSRKKFDGACYCLCYLHSNYGPNDKEKLTNYFKLLLNLSESIAGEHRRTVVDQLLNIISFYPFVMKDNPFLAEVIERKFVENIPHSLRALMNAARNYKFSQQTLQQLEAKTITIQTEENSFQGNIKEIWEVLLALEGRTYDAREASLTTDKAQILSYVLRNFAGLELFGLSFKVNWSAVHAVLNKNLELMAAICMEEGDNALRFAKNNAHLRANTCLIKLCCLYCRLIKQAGSSPIQDQAFLQVAQTLLGNSYREQTDELASLLR